jgi:tripartite ATP-independent transporter DctM subunit
MGGIYGGVFTATEAGGAGALGALVLALARRSLGWDSFLRTLTEAGSVTAAICFLLVSAFIYTRMIALTGIPNAMDEFIRNAGLGLGEILVIYIAVLLVLGTIIDAGSSILITVPLVLPVLAPYDVDLVWFGIITVIAVEIGLLTPPLGIACFVVHANLRDPRITLWDVFAGATPFALVMLAVLALITLVPWLSLVLVR